jgi:glycosyltransferase involved in cell wall biosynthesis
MMTGITPDNPNDRLNRPELLYVTDQFPYPLTTGYLRHYFLIRELASLYRIKLLALVDAGFRPDHAEAIRPYTSLLSTFQSNRQAWSLGRRLASGLQRLSGKMALDESGRQLRDAVSSLTSQSSVDAVLLAGYRHRIGDLIGNIPLVVDICDAVSIRIRGQLGVADALHAPGLLGRLVITRRVEERLAAEADHLLFASLRDRHAVLGDRDSPASSIVPNGVDLQYWKRRSRHPTGSAVIFTGAMDYPPNEDAALQLVELVMPLVWQRLPSARLLIVGRDPQPRLVAAARDRRIVVTGRVPDIRPYLEASAVYAAPLRFGSGIQNKLLEALAMELPIVTSPIGFAGLQNEDGGGPPMVVTDDPRLTRDAIVDELTGVERRSTTAIAGRRYVQRYFRWSTSARKVAAAIDGVSRRAGPLPGSRS